MKIKFSDYLAMCHLLRETTDGDHDRILSVASQRPSLIGKTIETIITKNEMVEQSDAQ